MSTYNGRRGPNMTEYLAAFNTIPPTVPESSGKDVDDFNMLINTDFFDYSEIGEVPNDFGTTSDGGANNWNGQQATTDFLNADFNFDFTNIPVLSNPGPSSTTVTSPISPNFALAGNGTQQAQRSSTGNSPSGLPASTQQPQQHASPSAMSAGTSAQKRKLSMSDPSLTLEERTRLAAEEDKRRRNTAASARFRIKKKQRELALERQSKEMTEKAAGLEKRVRELEMENRWLKSLITEKKGAVPEEDWRRLVAEGTSKADVKEEGNGDAGA